LAQGNIEPAVCADHITRHAGDVIIKCVRHAGDVNAFFLSPLQSLCSACHALKTAREVRGYAKTIGLDGMPVDPNHPAYQWKNRL